MKRRTVLQKVIEMISERDAGMTTAEIQVRLGYASRGGVLNIINAGVEDGLLFGHNGGYLKGLPGRAPNRWFVIKGVNATSL